MPCARSRHEGRRSENPRPRYRTKAAKRPRSGHVPDLQDSTAARADHPDRPRPKTGGARPGGTPPEATNLREHHVDENPGIGATKVSRDADPQSTRILPLKTFRGIVTETGGRLASHPENAPGTPQGLAADPGNLFAQRAKEGCPGRQATKPNLDVWTTTYGSRAAE